MKEKQAPRAAPKPSSSTSRLREFKETVSNMIHSRPQQISQTNQNSSHGGSSTDQAETRPSKSLSSAHARDWEVESTSSESKSSSSSRYRPTWRPKRESLNIDSIFSKDKRKHCGYTQLSPFSEEAGKQLERKIYLQICGIYSLLLFLFKLRSEILKMACRLVVICVLEG